jgi:hypothetical protein
MSQGTQISDTPRTSQGTKTSEDNVRLVIKSFSETLVFELHGAVGGPKRIV